MSIGTKGYFGMGYTYVNGRASMLTDWWEYDPSATIWTRKKDPTPAARYLAASFVIDDKGYLGQGGTYNTTPVPNDWWQYDPATDNWTKKSTPPTSSGGFQNSRGDRRAFDLLNGKGYLITFQDASPIFSTLVHEYDPTTDRWTQKRSFPEGYRMPNAVVGFGALRAFLFGGRDFTKDYKDVWSFTP